MELLISSAIGGTILLLKIEIIFDVLIDSIIFIVVFSTLRVFVGGFHSRSFVVCNIITVLNFVIVLIIYRCFSKMLLFPFVYSIMFVFSFVLCALFAPVENINNPIKDVFLTKYKIKLLTVILIDVIVFIVFLRVFKMTTITIVLPTLVSVDVFMVIPLLLKQRRNKNEKY